MATHHDPCYQIMFFKGVFGKQKLMLHDLWPAETQAKWKQVKQKQQCLYSPHMLIRFLPNEPPFQVWKNAFCFCFCLARNTTCCQTTKKSFNATTAYDGEEDTTVSLQSPLQWLSAVTTEEEEAFTRFTHWLVSPGKSVGRLGETADDFIIWPTTHVPTSLRIKLLPRQC